MAISLGNIPYFQTNPHDQGVDYAFSGQVAEAHPLSQEASPEAFLSDVSDAGPWGQDIRTCHHIYIYIHIPFIVDFPIKNGDFPLLC